MNDIIEKDSFFKLGKVNAIPYKHYQNSLVWIVRVWKDDRPVDEETATILRIVAIDAKEAASLAIQNLESHLKNQKEALKLRDEMFTRVNAGVEREKIKETSYTPPKPKKKGLN